MALPFFAAPIARWIARKLGGQIVGGLIEAYKSKLQASNDRDRIAADLDGLPFTVRRRGLFMGLQFADPGAGMAAAADLIRNGVFAIFANNDPSVVQFLPPLTITDDEVDELLGIVRATFG